MWSQELKPRAYLNLNLAAWRRIEESRRLPVRSDIATQRFIAAPMLSALELVQARMIGTEGSDALSDAVVVLGYWRSGTTLLHEYLSVDPNRAFPTTYACMNPHHFVLTQENILAGGKRQTKRPMDSRVIQSSSPQETEFALLCLGAPSPYEALMFPGALRQSLAIADHDNLSPSDREVWTNAFTGFLRGVHHVGNRRPLILKSPTHGFHLPTLSQLLPNARFVLIVRDPRLVFESAMRMWLSLFAVYAYEPVPEPDEIREIVLANRIDFERKLWQGLSALPSARWTMLRYESLIENPAKAVAGIYEQLGLEGFDEMRQVITQKIRQEASFRSETELPSDVWQERIHTCWKEIFERYDYQL